MSCFVESERLSNGNNSVLNEYDKVVINKVKSLCEEARESISHINGSNFKQTLFNLIKLDAKISSYLFFLNFLRWNIHESDKWIFYNEVS
ncbi:hypothetical protein EfmAA818_27290 [Enterococcus faecium]|nr:hypothetical protein EfmAA818_27290 [Enterococcus faecium]